MIFKTGTKQHVFSVGRHICDTFRRDLKRAGIEVLDALGRKVDFHALRKTFATRLAVKGVPQRFAQELMRHSDANLTAGIYTDASQLPTFEAVASLDWEGSVSYTHLDTHRTGLAGHAKAKADSREPMPKVDKTLDNIEQCRGLARAATARQKGEMMRGGGSWPPFTSDCWRCPLPMNRDLGALASRPARYCAECLRLAARLVYFCRPSVGWWDALSGDGACMVGRASLGRNPNGSSNPAEFFFSVARVAKWQTRQT